MAPHPPSPPPWWTNSPSRSPSTGSGDNRDFQLGHLLGQVVAGQQTTHGLLAVLANRLTELPRDLAREIKSQDKKLREEVETEAKSITSIATGAIQIMHSLKQLLYAAIPLALLTTIALGKVTFSEALPLLRTIIRQLLGAA